MASGAPLPPDAASIGQEAAGMLGPPGAAVRAVLEYHRLAAFELQEAARAVRELADLQRRRVHESKGVFRRIVRFRNAAGVNVGAAGVLNVNLNDVAKEKMRSFSMVTSPVGAVGAEPETDAIYVKFGRGMGFEGAENTPSNYDLVFKRGDKVNQLRTPQGIENIQVYSLRSFDAVMFVTAGDPAALPSF